MMETMSWIAIMVIGLIHDFCHVPASQIQRVMMVIHAQLAITIDYDCNCIGVLVDSDDDGISDSCDLCPGHDDLLDTDNDGIPDGCDECIGMQGSICESGDCLVNDDPIPTGTHAALLRVSSGGAVVDSIVTFQSTGQVELMPGFKVEVGAVFEAQIVDCDNILSSKQLIANNCKFPSSPGDKQSLNDPRLWHCL